ncbi:MAG: hypothetical protein D6719_07090 [Candidatus Dadabacteria bacterium]|nr:MAG: hypothetical protein D6719_07090 [Candidatus Dadabacteria bacterium]
MLIVIGSQNRYLSNNLERLVSEFGFRKIRTNKVERVIRELKSTQRLAIIDMEWKEIQKPGVLRQMVNVGRISANIFVCICPNQDEDLKRLARSVNPDEIFLRYDLELSFKDFLKAAALKSKIKK